MFGFQKKVLLISTGESYSEDDTPSVYSQELNSCADVVNALVNDVAYDHSAMQVLLGNKAFLEALDRAGFRDVEKIKDVEAKISAGKRFYVYDVSGYSNSLKEIDLTNMGRYEAERLGSEKVMILQSVDKSSLSKVNNTAYRHMLGFKKRMEAAAKARTAKAAQRAERKKAKEIEKAKQLLTEAGEL